MTIIDQLERTRGFISQAWYTLPDADIEEDGTCPALQEHFDEIASQLTDLQSYIDTIIYDIENNVIDVSDLVLII